MRLPSAIILPALLALMSAFCLTAKADSSAVAIARVWPGYRTAESFERISEYFTGRENPGRETILRSQPDARAGYYFLARVQNSGGALAEAVVELQVITPTTPQPKTFTFKCALPAGNRAINLGLTGKDWPGEKANPVAWSITIKSPDGRPLAHEQSFLWSK
jgi:hypothetical protein